MIKLEINQTEFRNYSYVEVDDSLGYPFYIQTGLVPSDEKPLTDSLLHKGVVVSFAPEDGDKERFTWIEESKSYYGYVAQEERHYDMHGNLAEVSLYIFHPIYLLNDGCQFRIFHEKGLTEIFNAVFQPYKDAWSKYKIGAPEYSQDLSQITIPYCTQYQETDLHFLLRLCEMYGVRFFLHDQKVCLQGSSCPPVGEVFSIPEKARIHWREKSCSLARNLTHRNIEYTRPFYEGSTQVVTQTNEAKSTASSASAPYPYWLDIFEPNQQKAQYFMEVQKKYLQHAEFAVEMHNQSGDNNAPLVGIRAGHKLLPPGAEKDKAIQVYHVHWETTGHAVGGGQGAVQQKLKYEITIQGREVKYPYIMPARHDKPRVDGFLRATVIQPAQASDGDKERLGRIKVQILWQEKPGPTCWVRLLMPYAGKEHGFYVMPEVGDEVLIGFEGGDIDRPVCLGSVYNKDAKALQRFDEARQITTALLKTPNTIYLKFHDLPNQQGEQTAIMAVQGISVIQMDNKAKINICVQNKSGNSLVCLDQTKITIHTNGQQKSVVCLDQGKINVSAEASVIVEAKEVTVQGSSTVDIKGGTINLKGGTINLGMGAAGPISVPSIAGSTGDPIVLGSAGKASASGSAASSSGGASGSGSSGSANNTASSSKEDAKPSQNSSDKKPGQTAKPAGSGQGAQNGQSEGQNGNAGQQENQQQQEEKPKKKYCVVIDPGHGGKDPGACNGSNHEADFNLAIGQKIKQALESQKPGGVEVIMTRDSDVFIELTERTKLANSKKADCFVSIHHNGAANDKACGFETIISANASEKTTSLAQKVHGKLKANPLKDRGIIKDSDTPHKKLHVLRATTMPAILIECAFISNASDLAWISNQANQTTMAGQIAQGVLEHLDSSAEK